MRQLYQFITNKQGVELTLTLIVEMIIAVVVLIVLIIFFTGGFSENFPSIIGAGESGIDNARGD